MKLDSVSLAATCSLIVVLAAFTLSRPGELVAQGTFFELPFQLFGAISWLSFFFLIVRDHYRRGFFRTRPILTAFMALALPIYCFFYYLMIYLPRSIGPNISDS